MHRQILQRLERFGCPFLYRGLIPGPDASHFTLSEKQRVRQRVLFAVQPDELEPRIVVAVDSGGGSNVENFAGCHDGSQAMSFENFCIRLPFASG